MAAIETQIERIIRPIRVRGSFSLSLSRKSLASLPVSNPNGEFPPSRQLLARESSDDRARELSSSSRGCLKT